MPPATPPVSDPPVAAPRPTTDSRRIGVVVIEIANNKNRMLMWGPTKNLLRGRWLRANLFGVTMKQELTNMPDMPGQTVTLDAGRRRAVIHDPLSEQENQEVREKIHRVIKEVFRTLEGPAKDTVFENVSETDVKTWLYAMRRAVDAGMAEVIRGTLPSLAEIDQLPGRIRTELYNSSARARKYRDEEEENIEE